MTVDKYIPKIRKITESFDPTGRSRYFVFGSSVRKDKFNDIDIGVVGAKSGGINTTKLKAKIEDTNIPYFVDVVDFDRASQSFKDYVFSNEPIVWIN
jgi:predicted nucleotidyltransferase